MSVAGKFSKRAMRRANLRNPPHFASQGSLMTTKTNLAPVVRRGRVKARAAHGCKCGHSALDMIREGDDDSSDDEGGKDTDKVSKEVPRSSVVQA